MKVIVTCGPSYEPIDQVRRLTNFSTGEPTARRKAGPFGAEQGFNVGARRKSARAPAAIPA
jgi:phosphopantothenoylcysteine synthetase/decarboxylase